MQTRSHWRPDKRGRSDGSEPQLRSGRPEEARMPPHFEYYGRSRPWHGWAVERYSCVPRPPNATSWHWLELTHDRRRLSDGSYSQT